MCTWVGTRPGALSRLVSFLLALRTLSESMRSTASRRRPARPSSLHLGHALLARLGWDGRVRWPCFPRRAHGLYAGYRYRLSPRQLRKGRQHREGGNKFLGFDIKFKPGKLTPWPAWAADGLVQRDRSSPTSFGRKMALPCYVLGELQSGASRPIARLVACAITGSADCCARPFGNGGHRLSP